MNFPPPVRTALVASLLLAAAPPLPAGEPAPAAPREEGPAPTATREHLLAALGALADAAEVSFAGEASLEEPPDETGGLLSGALVMGAGASARPFTGPFEAWRTKEDEVLLCSASLLPGVVVYERDLRVVTRTTVEDEPVGASYLAGDLVSLLRFEDLARAASRADVGITAAGEGGTLFTVALPRRLVRTQARSPLGLFDPKVRSLEARILLDAARRPTSLEFRVERSDPMGSLQRRALSGGLTAGEVRLAPGEEVEDEGPGRVHVYALRPAASPSDRARGELASLRKAIGAR